MERVTTLALNRWKYVEAAKRLAASAFPLGIEVDIITNLEGVDREECFSKVIHVTSNQVYSVKLCLPDLVEEGTLYMDADCLLNHRHSDPMRLWDIEPFGAYTTPYTTLPIDWVRYGIHHAPSYFHSCVMRIDERCKGIFNHAWELWQDMDGYASDEAALMVACARLGVRPNHIPTYMAKVSHSSERWSNPVIAFQGSHHKAEDLRLISALSSPKR